MIAVCWGMSLLTIIEVDSVWTWYIYQVETYPLYDQMTSLAKAGKRRDTLAAECKHKAFLKVKSQHQ